MVYIATVKVFELEEQLFQQQAVEQELRQAHVAELAEVQQKMRVQMEEEKQNFLQQIRELTRLKEDAYAKVCIWRVQGISEMVQASWWHPVENGWIDVCNILWSLHFFCGTSTYYQSITMFSLFAFPPFLSLSLSPLMSFFALNVY